MTTNMQEVSNGFIVNLVGAVFALIIMPATASLGFGLFLINAIAFACFVAPIVVAHRENRATDSHAGHFEA